MDEFLKTHLPDVFNGIGRETWSKASLASAIAALLAGCAIHPVQQDVTGVPTPDLVQYIRCETRLAIQDKAIDLLRRENLSNPMIDALTDGRGRPWPPTIRARMNAHERAVYDQYIKTGIAYDFTFDITVDNAGSGAADPVKLLTNGTAGLSLSASSDFKRENRRHFIVSETAQDLLENGTLPCGPGLSSFKLCVSDCRKDRHR